MVGKAHGNMIGPRHGSRSGKVPVCGLLAADAGTYSIWLIILLSMGQLIGCSAPVRAPVVSRDHPPAQQRSARPSTYHVQRGDTLYSISWRFGIDYASLASWNGIRYPYTIYPGQKLRMAPTGRRWTVKNYPTKTPQTQVAAGSDKSVASDKTVSRSVSKGVSSSQDEEKISSISLKLQWLWPTKGSVVQRFVKGDPMRKGVKIEGRIGEPVNAAESGKVVYAGSGLIGYGRLVIIKHNKNYLSAYGYNKKIHVKEGDTVKKGIRIAEMGSDGNGKPVLHFEIRRNGAPVDPLKLLPRHP